MIRVVLFLVLAATLAAYSFWVYTRAELPVRGARWLALARAVVLVVVLLLLFDPRVPSRSETGVSTRWVLLDASLSMSAVGSDGSTAWEAARRRASDLAAEGWNVVRFGGDALRPDAEAESDPAALRTRLGPALQAAAESGAREVRVLSDFRVEDGVAMRAALETLPLTVAFESVGAAVDNRGIAHFEVPDVLRPGAAPVAEIEVFGGAGDSITVEILEEDRPVATVTLPAPTEGLRAATSVDLPEASNEGRVRYTARVADGTDGFPDDDRAVSYASIGFEEGGLVLVSTTPGWEPRYLLPVLEDVTGLSATGFLRAGDDRFVRMGRAADRGTPADSATVRRAVADAAVLVVDGLSAETDAWIRTLTARPGRRLVLPTDVDGAAVVGLEVDAPRTGEWYASPDVPVSPIAGALAGVALQGLPPLSAVMVPRDVTPRATLDLQLRGVGPAESAFRLIERPSGRVAVALASGFWRWAARDAGREPYRRLWSGVAGWLLADETVASAEPRPTDWVVPRGEPVRWSIPGDSTESRVVVRDSTAVVVDTTLTGGVPSTGLLGPGPYSYAVLDPAGDTIGSGRFDVSASTTEMLPAVLTPELPVRAAGVGPGSDGLGRPLRTFPWPYLLIIVLLCVEWIARRRSGLR